MVETRATRNRVRGANHKVRAGLALGLALALALRIGLSIATDVPSSDGVSYLSAARNLAAYGAMDPVEWSPGYSSAVAGILTLGGVQSPTAPLRAAQPINVAATLGLGGLAFVALRRRFGDALALVAAIWIWAAPISIVVGVGDTPDALLGCLWLGSWLLRERRPGWAGVLAGAATLVDAAGWLFLLGLVASYARDRHVWIGVAAGGMATLAGAAVVGQVIAPSWTSSLLHAWKDLPGAIAAGQGLGVLYELPRVIGWGATGLVALGFAAAPGRWWLLLLPAVVIGAPFDPQPRMWVAMLPALWLAALYGLELMAELWEGWGRQAALVTAGAALVLWLFAAAEPYRQLQPDSHAQSGYRRAGLWLRAEGAPRATVLVDPLPYTSYWAWCRHLPLSPEVGLSRAIAWATRHGADALVVQAGLAATSYPELLPLVGNIPEHLRDKVALAQAFEDARAPEASVYLYALNRHR